MELHHVVDLPLQASLRERLQRSMLFNHADSVRAADFPGRGHLHIFTMPESPPHAGNTS